MAPYGIEAYPCHVGQLRYADGRVWLGERAIDVVYRLFMMEDLLDPAGPGLIEPVLRAAERGEVAIFTPMDADLYGSKGALALLSDEQYRDRYTAEELASLDRIVPWTRMVRPGPVTVDGRQVDLFEHALAEQQELIIKPTMMHGGHRRRARLADRRRGMAAAAGGGDGSAVRPAAADPSDPELFPTDDGPQRVVAQLGRVPGGRGYGGMFVRGSRDPDETVNMSTGAIGTCCFHPASTSRRLSRRSGPLVSRP